jgi:hypothetical protein
VWPRTRTDRPQTAVGSAIATSAPYDGCCTDDFEYAYGRRVRVFTVVFDDGAKHGSYPLGGMRCRINDERRDPEILRMYWGRSPVGLGGRTIDGGVGDPNGRTAGERMDAIAKVGIDNDADSVSRWTHAGTRGRM